MAIYLLSNALASQPMPGRAILTTVGRLKVEQSHRIVNGVAHESKLPSGVAKQGNRAASFARQQTEEPTLTVEFKTECK